MERLYMKCSCYDNIEADKVRVNSISPRWIDTDYTVAPGSGTTQLPVDRLKSLIGRVQPVKTVNYSCKQQGKHLNQEELK